METLAQARELFLSAEAVDSGVVRQSILASWVRSRDWQISADPFELPYVANVDGKSQLAHGAGEVLTEAYDQFANEPATIILTDAAGVVLVRRTGDDRLRRKLDRVSLAPGFSYAEQFAGTNGIGTALELGEPAVVFGHEHYVEHLEDLACAGAPIRHPITGKLLGIVDLTCWRDDANPMMVTAATSIARRIEEALLATVSRREFDLLRQYLATTQRTSNPVLAISDDLVMMNDSARELIEPRDQIALLGVATEALVAGKAGVFTTMLPSGATAQVHGKPSQNEPGTFGGVLQVNLITAESEARAVGYRAARTSRYKLPGVGGSSMRWLTCCQEVEATFRSGQWLHLTGEAGAGKLTVARGTHLAHTPAAHLRVLDADDSWEPNDWLDEVAKELARGAGTLILRHVDRLRDEVLNALSELLESTSAADDRPRPWVVSTHSSGAEVTEALDRLIGCFPASVEATPLRHHIEDLPEIVDVLLARLSKGANLTCSPDATRVLMRNRWPGNVEQLLGALRKVVAHKRAGVIDLTDLPAECLATTRRVLTPLESIECDAVVESLIQAGGDRAKAARSLGMSRATIYRKIRDYGIAVPNQSRSRKR